MQHVLKAACRGVPRTVACVRWASSASSSPCPFGVLGVEKSSSYSDVKNAFVKLALKHHPDTSEKDDDNNVETFWKIRTAFESISNDNGTAVVTNNSDSAWTDESLSAWFERQTGRRLSFRMDLQTRREVAHVANTMSPGGLDRGGMWELAKTVARHEKELEGGITPKPQISHGTTSSTGRRRKRR